MYLNKAFIFGNLTRDPEVRALPSGAQVASFALATNRVYKDKEGRKQENTDFHNVVAFGRLAEVIAQYARKGSSLFVEGRIQTRSWDGADGKKNYRTEIVVENFQFGPKSGGSAGKDFAKGAPADVAPAEDTIEYPQENIQTDDIPF